MPFDEPGIRAITLSLISIAAVLSLASVILGLIATMSERDPLPKRIRSLMRRVPASAEDFRLRGMSLMLNGAGVAVMVSLIGTNLVLSLSPGGYAPAALVTFESDAGFFVSILLAVVALALVIASATLSLRVRYTSTRSTSARQPGTPPA